MAAKPGLLTEEEAAVRVRLLTQVYIPTVKKEQNPAPFKNLAKE